MIKTVTVGLQQKIGQPNFGSVGASCSIEVQLDSDEADAPEVIAARIKHAFDRCRQSIDEELQHQDRETVTTNTGTGFRKSAPPRDTTSRSRSATDAQVRAIRAIASRHGIVLASELHGRFGARSPTDLTVGQASELIDALKAPATPA
mgnify:CR=1 FL=1